MQIKDVSEQHAGTYTLVLRNRLAGLEKRISLQLIVNGKGGGQGWGRGDSTEPVAPVFGLLQDQGPHCCPKAVGTYLISFSPIAEGCSGYSGAGSLWPGRYGTVLFLAPSLWAEYVLAQGPFPNCSWRCC